VLLRRGVSGRSLAAQLGESQTWLSSRLRGETPIDLNDLRRIAAVLEVTPASLLPTGDSLTTAYYLQKPQAAPHAVDVRSHRRDLSGSGRSRAQRSRRLLDRMAA
jgi:transcriptional regulator with XRE-family HTH domain